MSCPVKGEIKDKYNEAASDLTFGQERHENQSKTLNTTRQSSTIPKSDFTPDHQPQGQDKWVYPSGHKIRA